MSYDTNLTDDGDFTPAHLGCAGTCFRRMVICRPLRCYVVLHVVIHTNPRKFMLLSISKKFVSFLHIRQKTEMGRPKMCSASDAQIVKNPRRSAALWAFLGVLCYVQPVQCSVGCSHYEFLLHPPDWVQRRGTNGELFCDSNSQQTLLHGCSRVHPISSKEKCS